MIRAYALFWWMRQASARLFPESGAEGNCTDERMSSIRSADYGWILVSGYALSDACNQHAFGKWINELEPAAQLVFDPSPVVATIPAELLKLAQKKSTWISANTKEVLILTGQSDPATAAEILVLRGNGLGGAVVPMAAISPHPNQALPTDSHFMADHWHCPMSLLWSRPD